MKKLSLIISLPVLFGLLVLFALNMTSLYQTQRIIQRFEDMEQNTLSAERQTSAILASFKTQVQEWKNVLLRGYEQKNLDKYWQSFVKHETQIQRELDDLERHYRLPPEILSEIQAFRLAHQTMAEQYRQGLAQFIQANHDPKFGDKVVKGMDREPAARLASLEDKIAGLARSELSAMKSTTDAAINSILLLSLLLTFSTVALVLYVLRQQVIRPTKSITQGVKDLMNCHYESPIRYQSQHELGALADATRHMQGKMQTTVNLLSLAQQEVNHSFDALQDVSKIISQGAHDQQSVSHQLQLGMENLNQIVTKLQTVTDMVSSSSNQAKHNADQCFHIFDNANKGFERLVVDTEQTSKLIEALQSKSADITRVVRVINEIADQTNLLALNAAIEAARAGDHGRGFAVVADEVRSLALKTQNSTADIQSMLSGFQQDSANAVSAMLKGRDQCITNADEAKSALQRLNELVSDVSGIESVVSDLNQAAEAQSAVLVQMNACASQVVESSEAYIALSERTDVSNAVKHASNNLHQVVEALTTPLKAPQESSRIVSRALQVSLR
ncbi:methyl-accepting chemotaxis protein [Bowmanella yangjiangensis]|uniref:Chemotaxis protein n=1 Tax=Bowmanella yangjiangensis TaxID=2811230 RepID=A0ABS3CQU2_9ALTE|nr:methyl-accepting chemotaxis protein [Bowmanella yangjiangensis]MBN7819045.1 chemotaxis protein [Bowmanella yangjiangensis]